MANFNLSLTLGGTTRTRTGTATAANITRFVAALRVLYPQAADDNTAVDLFLSQIVAEAKSITRDQETKVAFQTVTDIDIA